MRVAGLRLSDGRAVWVDAGEHQVRLLDRADACTPEGRVSGLVFVTPEQVVGMPPETGGVLIEVTSAPPPDDDCSFLPGSELPILGSRVQAGSRSGVVVALDPVHRRVTLATEPGQELTIDLEDIEQLTSTRDTSANQ